jgi:hypothetical protein
MTALLRSRLRPSVPALVLSVLAALVVPVAATGPTSAAPAPRPVKAATRSVALPAAVAPAAGRAQSRTSSVELGGGLHVVGVTWARGSGKDVAAVELRERDAAGTWGAWQPVESDGEDGPDASDQTSATRGGTDPYVTTADAVQVRVVGAAGARRLPAARLEVIDPKSAPADAAPTTAGAASAGGTKPTIYSRAQWGADESIRTHHNTFGVVKAAVVHHTAGSNSYTAADVPAIIRGIYVFHTVDRGWGDIGYNFLVDKFGRIWEGRYGGVDLPVVGAQAGGYNSQTFGSSTIGDYTSVTPPSAVVTAQSKLIAWKLGLSHVDPTATTFIDNAGTRNTVMGHRDLNQTGCPGTQLYAKLPAIRTAAKSYQATMFYDPSVSRSTYAYGGGGATVTARPSTALTWRLSVQSVCRTTPEATLTGTASPSSPISAAWNGLGSDGKPVPPGTYELTLTANNGTGTSATVPPAVLTVVVTSTPGAPQGYCPPRLSGSDRYATAVAVARETDDAAKVVVVASGVETSMPDALVAAPLARSKGGVLLLSGPKGLTSATTSEISRRGVTTAYLVGGTAAVPSSVTSQLQSLGVTSVSRVAGADRYATAAAVARAMGGERPDVMVASGFAGSMADGLLLSGPAAELGRPILLVKTTGVPAPTRSALADLRAVRTVVAGGTGVVAPSVLSALPSPTRLAGADRYGTGTAIGSWAATRVPVARITLASGENAALIDSLSGGQLGQVTMPAKATSVPSTVRTWLSSTSGLESLVVVGGQAVVGDRVAGEAAAAITG